MEKQFWAGATLLILLLILALGVSWGMYALHLPAQTQLEQAVRAARCALEET